MRPMRRFWPTDRGWRRSSTTHSERCIPSGSARTLLLPVSRDAGTSLSATFCRHQGGDCMGKDIAVFGLYATRTELEGAVEALRSAGFRGTDVSILMPQDRATHELGHEVNSKAPEAGVTGAAAGGAVGGVLAWLASIGMLTIPGIGPLLAAGPIVAALAGIGAG